MTKPLPLVLIGLILLLAGQSWFTGAATVGWICLAVGLAPFVILAVITLVGLIVALVAAVFGR